MKKYTYFVGVQASPRNGVSAAAETMSFYNYQLVLDFEINSMDAVGKVQDALSKQIGGKCIVMGFNLFGTEEG